MGELVEQKPAESHCPSPCSKGAAISDGNGQDHLARYAQRVGYSEEDLKHIGPDDPRRRHINRLVEIAGKYTIVAEVVESEHCSSGHQAGDYKLFLDTDGNFLTKLCPKRVCVYLAGQLMIPVALINERLSSGLDPNRFHFSPLFRCPDTGVACSGYGKVTVKVRVVPRQEAKA